MLAYSIDLDYETDVVFHCPTNIHIIGSKGKPFNEAPKEHGGPGTLLQDHFSSFPNLFNISLS